LIVCLKKLMDKTLLARYGEASALIIGSWDILNAVKAIEKALIK